MDQTIQDLQRQIDDLKRGLDGLSPIVSANADILKNLPSLAGNPVVNVPTPAGYVPFFINGQRINLISGS